MQKCSFIRCIKPNESQCRGVFDENLVRTQLISSGSIAYQQLMRAGYPSHWCIAELFNKFEKNPEFKDYTSTNPKDFCHLLLQSCGLKWKDYKLGHSQIFFRTGKFELLYEQLKEDTEIIKQRLMKLRLRKKFRAAILATIISIRLCIKARCEKSNAFLNEMQTEEIVDMPRKRIKLSRSIKQRPTCTSNKVIVKVAGSKGTLLHSLDI